MTPVTHQLRRTKIIATLGPATDGEMLKQVLTEGVDVVRLNFSHGKPDDHRERAAAVRAAAAELGIEVAILGDLQGPKIRVEAFADGPVQLQVGDRFDLDCREDAPLGDSTRVGVGYEDLWKDVKPGDLLLLDDGLIALEVVRIAPELIECVVTIGGKLASIITFTETARALVVSMAFPKLGLLYLTASSLASAAPTPGGVGAVEAGLAAALTGVGVPVPDALSVVFLFRLMTYWLPVPVSYLALRNLRSAVLE